MRMRFLPDEPITSSLEDALGFGDFVQLIQESVYNTDTPFVYGVLGDWGAGKTSILRMLESRLAREIEIGSKPFVPIWFNAWHYENEANIVYPLLYTIQSYYKQRFKTLDATKGFGKKFLEVVATSTLALADVGLRAVTKHLIGDALKLEDIDKQFKSIKDHPSELDAVMSGWADEVTRLHESFEELLGSFASDLASADKRFARDDVRFVIMVDDLDRCLPETAIAVLESIKNYLSVKNCVFILCLNQDVIYQGIRIKYKGLAIKGKEYLEKILNYSFYVPEPEATKVSQFAAQKLQELVLDEESQAKFATYFNEFGQILQDCHFGNPRKIKRILNRYLFFLKKHQDNLLKYNNSNIVRFIVLAEYFPEIFQVFLSNADSAKAQFIKLRDKDFETKELREKFGIQVSTDYPYLPGMVQLFEFIIPTDAKMLDLTEHARAVDSITHM